MLTLPSEVVVGILGFLTFDNSDYECCTDPCDDPDSCRYPNPVRRDILQLYCTCKAFSWLDQLWITDVYGSLIMHSTFNIFGDLRGPIYMFDTYDGDEGSLSGYKFVIGQKLYSSIDIIKGNYIHRWCVFVMGLYTLCYN